MNAPTAAELMAERFGNCSGCGRKSLNDPCWNCVKARAAAVGNHGRCPCAKADRRPRVIVTFNRSWESCDRCLGVIKHLPDPPRGGKS